MTRSTKFACFCTAQTSIFQQNFVKECLRRDLRGAVCSHLVFELDSMLVVMFMLGMWGCHRNHLRVLLQECHDLGKPSFFVAVPGPYVMFTGNTTLLRTSLRVRPSSGSGRDFRSVRQKLTFIFFEMLSLCEPRSDVYQIAQPNMYFSGSGEGC